MRFGEDRAIIDGKYTGFIKRGKCAMPTRRLRLKRLAGGLRMRSKDHFNRLREKRLRPMGVSGYPALMSIPILLGLVILVGWMRTPQTAREIFRPMEDAFVTPMAGWAVCADTWGTDDRLEVSLVYAEATWAELEPEEGKFDFEGFEARNHLNEWWAEGKRLILRIVCDRPGEAGHKDIPDWLVEKMGGEILAGRFYEAESGSGFAPDYSSIGMRDAHRKLISALADRYDDHPGVAYIELGSLGQNGEWTVDQNETGLKLPTSIISREYAWHYTSEFEHTLMLMRRPYLEAQMLSIGLYNPELGDFEATWTYLDTIEQGGYDKMIETDLIAMPDHSDQSPSGAHISGEIDLDALLAGNRSELARQMVESRLSYAVIEQDTEELDDETVQLLQEMDALIGYRLWLRSAKWDCRLHAGIRSKVILTFRNDGAAPMYAGWPVMLALFDGEEMICGQITGLDTSMILPGDNELTTWIDIPAMTDVGVYTLKLTVLDPDSGKPDFRLANEGIGEESLWLELGELRVIGKWEHF